MPAVRNIPYGIQQPAVSSQIAQLEEFLGVDVVPPAALRADGGGRKTLRVRPAVFFQPRKNGRRTSGRPGAAHPHRRLDDCAARASAGIVPERAEKIFRPETVAARGFAGGTGGNAATRTRLTWPSRWWKRKPPPGIHSLALLELPLVLLVPKNSGVKSAEELWRRDTIDEPLICFPPGEPLSRNFQAQLNEARRGLVSEHRGRLGGPD